MGLAVGILGKPLKLVKQSKLNAYKILESCAVLTYRMEEEPQDIDYRVGPPPRLQSQMSTASDVEIPNDLSVEHHSDILLKVKVHCYCIHSQLKLVKYFLRQVLK